ncbi:GNAT family N-acetyltransferase [Actinomyces culturomici]|uniref:GNAT family N-acetyltransferase n=1 Tax=Actinomyces culturomici TaxID=1926276 RepID=UPI000E206B4D|nr:GNAT family N-acetyltransferase [Actinomyces culturomici]
MAEAATADETAVKASGVRLRRATAADLDAIAALEALAFPPTEAAPRTAYADRLATYPEHILLAVAEDGAVDAEGVAGTEKPAGTGTLLAFVVALATNRRDLADDMFADASIHDPDGDWLMILSVASHPGHRGAGHPTALLRLLIDDARREGRTGLVLTCKAAKLGYYARLGFIDEGVSAESEHGGEEWNQMRLVLDAE